MDSVFHDYSNNCNDDLKIDFNDDLNISSNVIFKVDFNNDLNIDSNVVLTSTFQISDDEDDTHPNIDTPSLFKWRHEARLQRMEEFEQQKKAIRIEKEK